MRPKPLSRLLLLATLLAAPALHGQAPARVRRALAGTDVAVWNIVGTIEVQRGAGASVGVGVATRGADAARLRIDTGEVRGSSTLRVIYPSGRIRYERMGGGSRTTVRVRDDGTFSDGDGDRGDREDRGDRVEISGRDGLDAAADLVLTVPPGKRVRVYLAVGEVTVTNVESELLVDCSAARVTTTRTKGTLRVDTGSGDVRVTDAEGDLDLDTGSGSVDVTRVKGGVLRVDTGSGGVTGDGIEVTRLDVDVGSGAILLRGVRAHDVRLDSGSGDVDAALASNVRSMVIDTGSGGVTLRVPSTVGAELDVETGSGGIETELPITIRRHARDHLSGRIGDGEGRIRIDTGSGGVRILRVN